MRCPRCEGYGIELYIEYLEDGSTEAYWNECEKCGGSGEIIHFYPDDDEEVKDEVN